MNLFLKLLHMMGDAHIAQFGFTSTGTT